MGPPTKKKVMASWILRSNGYLKLNFDEASKGNPGQAGFWCVIHNHNSNVIRVICGPLGVCDAIKAEAVNLLMGLREMRKLDLKNCLVEGDSKVVIGWGSKSSMGF